MSDDTPRIDAPEADLANENGISGDSSRPSGPGMRRGLNTAVTILVAAVVAFVLAPNLILGALVFILLLGPLVIAHEFAHFATAKMFHVQVQEFGVGFPPRIGGKRFGETVYTVNWLPLGGFVKLLGEEDPTHPRSLAAQAAWKRLIVLASGSVVNLLLPLLLFTLAFAIPHEESFSRAVVSAVVPNAPAESAGFESGDVIYEVAGRDAQNRAETGRLIRLHVGEEIPVVVLRDGEFVTLRVTPRWSPPPGQGPTGITITAQCTQVGGVGCVPFIETVSDAPWEGFPRALQEISDQVILTRNEVISYFKSPDPADESIGQPGTNTAVTTDDEPGLMGPIGIADLARRALSDEGFEILLPLAALISFSLGVFNLLPWPGLDGGRILFVGIEVARGGRRVRPEREALVHLIGMAALLALFVFISITDIRRIFFDA